MRIIAGVAKGRHLKSVKGLNTRPTSDRVKEALFNILGEKVVGANVLDLFAGTGNLGLEALSRGANYAIFIEKDINAVKVIYENIANIGLEGTKVIKGDVFVLIESFKNKVQFDLIFADPPYRKGFAPKIISAVGESKLLKEGGILVIEQCKQEEKIPELAGLILVRSENYGDTAISFYRIQDSKH